VNQTVAAGTGCTHRESERERDRECQSRLEMHGFVRDGVTMSVIIGCLSGTSGTRWRMQRRGVEPKNEGGGGGGWCTENSQ